MLIIEGVTTGKPGDGVYFHVSAQCFLKILSSIVSMYEQVICMEEEMLQNASERICKML